MVMVMVAKPVMVVVVIIPPEEPMMVMMMVVVLHRFDLGGVGIGLFDQNSVAGLEKRNRIRDGSQ